MGRICHIGPSPKPKEKSYLSCIKLSAKFTYIYGWSYITIFLNTTLITCLQIWENQHSRTLSSAVATGYHVISFIHTIFINIRINFDTYICYSSTQLCLNNLVNTIKLYNVKNGIRIIYIALILLLFMLATLFFIYDHNLGQKSYAKIIATFRIQYIYHWGILFKNKKRQDMYLR